MHKIIFGVKRLDEVHVKSEVVGSSRVVYIFYVTCKNVLLVFRSDLWFLGKAIVVVNCLYISICRGLNFLFFPTKLFVDAPEK